MSHHFMALDGEEVETAFIFLDSKITADGDCSHKIKRRLLLGRKGMTNLDSVLKSRDITLQAKVHRVKVMVSAVVMCGCESWTIKKAEHQRIDAFTPPFPYHPSGSSQCTSPKHPVSCIEPGLATRFIHPQTRRGLTLLSQLCRDPAVGVRNAEEA